MFTGLEPLDGLAPDSLGRTVIRHQVGIRIFKLTELPEEFVVLAVGDLGGSLAVVQLVVPADLPP
jgi:hypothetical protein